MTISYNTYLEFGGTVSESAFPPLLIDVNVKINHITFNRFEAFLNSFATEQDIPAEIKRMLTLGIDFLANNNISTTATNVASYSNDIETFSFNSETGKNKIEDVDGVLYILCQEYLSNYPELLYRGRRV